MMDESLVLHLRTRKSIQAKDYPGRFHVLLYDAAMSHQRPK
jgi:hypothetical protein